jgi:SET domain-containing protein
MKRPVIYPTYIKRLKGKGWAAFCAKPIRKGAVFHICPLLTLSGPEAKRVARSNLEPYWYEWGTRGRAIALGLGCILNHSDQPNCSYRISKKNRTFSFYALRNIPAHEELTHDYGWGEKAYHSYGVKRDLADED